MSEFLTKIQEQMLIFSMIKWKIYLTVVVTFCLGWQATFAQVKWSNLDWNERLFSIICIIGLVGDKLIAFFDKTAGSLAKGQLPLDSLGEQHVDITTETKVTATGPVAVSEPKKD